jgi:hypothetical protein
MSYTPYTSAIWHAIQAVAECSITCTSHSSSYGSIDPLTPTQSVPFAGTSAVQKRYCCIRLGRALPCSQCHPNWLSRDYLGHCGLSDVVPFAEGGSLPNFRHNIWRSVHPGEWFPCCAMSPKGEHFRPCLRRSCREGDCGSTCSHQASSISKCLFRCGNPCVLRCVLRAD